MERENAPLLNNVMGNWKETFALLFRGFAFTYRGAHGWQVLSSTGDRVCFSAWGDISLVDLQGTKYRFCHRERELRFLCWVISSMQGSLYHKIQKSSQFYLISWNGKVFSRWLIKCSLTEGACLPGRPAPLSESLRKKREKYKNTSQGSHCTTEPPLLLMSEATLHVKKTEGQYKRQGRAFYGACAIFVLLLKAYLWFVL